MGSWPLLLLAGAFAGVFAGLLGIGGGFITVPVLMLLLPILGIDSDINSHLAIGSSLACICATSLSSIYHHHRRQAVQWQLVKKLLPGIIIGSALGSYLAAYLSSHTLAYLFALGSTLAAIQLLLPKKIKSDQHQLSPNYRLFPLFTGMISSLLGIGGGSILVPYLNYYQIKMVYAIATAAACGFPIAVVAAIGYCISGWNDTNLPEATSGFIYWPAVFSMTLGSITTAPIGVRLAHLLPSRYLKRVFATFLILMSAQIISSL